MAHLIRSETLKLGANWLNAASVTTIAGGVVAPVVGFLYKVGPQMEDPSQIWWLVTVCLLAGTALHVVGQALIGELIDDDE